MMGGRDFFFQKRNQIISFIIFLLKCNIISLKNSLPTVLMHNLWTGITPSVRFSLNLSLLTIMRESC